MLTLTARQTEPSHATPQEQYKGRAHRAESEVKAQKELLKKTKKDLVATHEEEVKKLRIELKKSQEENNQIKQRFSTFFNTLDSSSNLTGPTGHNSFPPDVASKTRADKKRKPSSVWTENEMMALYRLRCAIGSNDWKAIARTEKLSTKNRHQMSMKWIQHANYPDKNKCSPLETSFKRANAQVAWKTDKGVIIGIVTDCNKDDKTEEATWTITYHNNKKKDMKQDEFLAALDFYDENYKKDGKKAK